MNYRDILVETHGRVGVSSCAQVALVTSEVVLENASWRCEHAAMPRTATSASQCLQGPIIDDLFRDYPRVQPEYAIGRTAVNSVLGDRYCVVQTTRR